VTTARNHGELLSLDLRTDKIEQVVSVGQAPDGIALTPLSGSR